MKKIYRLTVLMFAMISVILTACKKDKNEGPVSSGTVTTEEKGTLYLHTHIYADQMEVDSYNTTYTTSDNRNISFSMAQFYISDIRLEKLDGSIYSVPDRKILKQLGTKSYEIGEVDAGNYKSLKFKVGLPANTNAEDPTTSADASILNKSEMWFNPSAAQPDGYIFMNLQGMIDTSSDLSDKKIPFIYKIGTQANYKEVSVTQNFGVSPNTSSYFHLVAKVDELFDGVTLDSLHLNVQSVSDNASAVATQVANNIPSMFEYIAH